jgi:hypothetical protein
MEGKMMIPGRSIRFLAGKPPLNPNRTSVWEASEKIKYIPAMGINKLDRRTEGGYHSNYG